VNGLSRRYFIQRDILDVHAKPERIEYLFDTPEGNEVIRNITVLGEEDPIGCFLYLVGRVFGRFAPEKMRSAIVLLTYRGKFSMAWKSKGKYICREVNQHTVLDFLCEAYEVLKDVLMERTVRGITPGSILEIGQMDFLLKESIVMTPRMIYSNDEERERNERKCKLIQLLSRKIKDEKICKRFYDLHLRNLLYTIPI
jgi:hypothetical protein